MNGNTLTSVLYFLAFGFFFYWMMKKGGCGMHSHGSHADHGRSELGNDKHAGHSEQREAGSDSTRDPSEESRRS
jgi:hypothetical protein